MGFHVLLLPVPVYHRVITEKQGIGLFCWCNKINFQTEMVSGRRNDSVSSEQMYNHETVYSYFTNLRNAIRTFENTKRFPTRIYNKQTRRHCVGKRTTIYKTTHAPPQWGRVISEKTARTITYAIKSRVNYFQISGSSSLSTRSSYALSEKPKQGQTM